MFSGTPFAKRLNAKPRQVKTTLARDDASADPGAGATPQAGAERLRGHCAVPTNFPRALNSFYWHVMRGWQHCLAAQPAVPADVPGYDADRGAFGCPARAPAPPVPTGGSERHDPRQEPGAVVSHARICAGGDEQSPSLPRFF